MRKEENRLLSFYLVVLPYINKSLSLLPFCICKSYFFFYDNLCSSYTCLQCTWKTLIHFWVMTLSYQCNNSKRSSLTSACHLDGVGYHSPPVHNLTDTVSKLSQSAFQSPSLITSGQLWSYDTVLTNDINNILMWGKLFSWERDPPFSHTILFLALNTHT